MVYCYYAWCSLRCAWAVRVCVWCSYTGSDKTHFSTQYACAINKPSWNSRRTKKPGRNFVYLIDNTIDIDKSLFVTCGMPIENWDGRRNECQPGNTSCLLSRNITHIPFINTNERTDMRCNLLGIILQFVLYILGYFTLGFGEIEEVLKTDITYEHTICSRLGVTANGMMS